MEETFWRNGHLKLRKVARSCFFKTPFALDKQNLGKRVCSFQNWARKNTIDSLKEDWKTKIQFWIVFKCYDKQSLER